MGRKMVKMENWTSTTDKTVSDGHYASISWWISPLGEELIRGVLFLFEN